MYIIEHYTLSDGWQNTWTDNTTDKEVIFDSYEQAEQSLVDYLEDSEENKDDYRITLKD